MSSPSLRRRIRNGSLLLLLIVIGIAAIALPKVYRLGHAIRTAVYGNYVSIEAAHHMHRSLDALQFAQQQGALADALPVHRDSFRYWIQEELKHTVEAGEAELAADIERRGNRLFEEIAASPANSAMAAQFSNSHGRLDELIRMNRAGMFRATAAQAD